ncbi:hypothetical protein AAVH_04894 [Aphelenchoides avenae]|nr:hypothetical protein AAVH_04894 [Aphelenchus avenae]
MNIELLPTEIIKSVYDFLDRVNLEALQLVDLFHRNFVSAKYAEFPLRRIVRMSVRAHDNIVLSLPDEDFVDPALLRPRIRSLGELPARLRNATVSMVDFDEPFCFDDVMAQALMPFASAWRRAMCITPVVYRTEEALMAAYSSLFLCRALRISDPVKEHSADGFSVSFFRLPAVVQCTTLTFGDFFSAKFHAHEVVQWLHSDNPRHQPRELSFLAVALAEETDYLVDLLKQEFNSDSVVRSYSLEIWSLLSFNVPEEVKLRKTGTSEVLKIVEVQPGHDSLCGLQVERYTEENKS